MDADVKERDRAEQYDDRECGDGRGKKRVPQRVIILQPGHRDLDAESRKGIDAIVEPEAAAGPRMLQVPISKPPINANLKAPNCALRPSAPTPADSVTFGV